MTELRGAPPGFRSAAGARATGSDWSNHLLGFYEELRSRVVGQVLDAALTSPLSFPYSGRPPSELLNAGSSGYRRVQGVMHRVSALYPGLLERSRKKLFDSARLPFGGENVRLLSFGSGATVFLVPGYDQRPPLVLKVFRKSLGRPMATLRQYAAQRRAAFERIASWYAGSSLVLPTHFVVLHGPLLSLAAVACVQPYVEGEHVDVFSSLSEQELIGILEGSRPLGEQFRLFVERTRGAARAEGACVDIVGQNNIVLTGSGDGRRLVLLDNGIYDMRRKAIRAPHRWAELERRLSYLQKICDRLTCYDAPGRADRTNVTPEEKRRTV